MLPLTALAKLGGSQGKIKSYEPRRVSSREKMCGGGVEGVEEDEKAGRGKGSQKAHMCVKLPEI